MATPIKADIIYYKADSDFELEFNLNGCCPMRLLSSKPVNDGELLSALSLAVSRSQIIFTVGTLQGEFSVIYNVCNAIGYTMYERDLSSLGVKERVMIPAGAIPLVSAGGEFGGCVIECGPQAIVVLTDDRALRKTIMRSLVHQYVRDFGKNSNNMAALIRKQEEKKNAVQQMPKKPQTEEPKKVEEPIQTKPYDTPQPTQKKHDFSKLEEEILAEEQPKKKGKKALTAILIILFLFVGMAAYIFLAEPLLIDEIYGKYRDMYGESGSFPSAEINRSFGALYSFNPDTVGYIKIDGTNVDYPVAHRKDNPSFYKDHLYNGYYSFLYGAIYTEAPISSDAYYQNIIIYGKDGKNNRMFSDLRKLTALSGYRESPTLRFDTLYFGDDYKIFAVLNTPKGEVDKKLLQTEFFDDAEYREYLDMLCSKSTILTTVDVNENDEIITLVATGYDKNTLVYARKVRPNESALVDTQNATENDGFILDVETDESVNPFDPFSLVQLEEVVWSSYSKTFEQYIKPKEYTPDAEEDTSSNVTSSQKPTDKEDEEKTEILLTVVNAETGKKESGSVQDILSRIVEAEMGENYHVEALRAQAVASYGWLLSNGADGENAPTVRLKTASTKTTTTVKSVLGLKPYYNGTLANTYYFRCSAGATISSLNYWAVDIPYLSSTDTSFDKNYDGYLTRRSYKAADIRDFVYTATGIDLNLISDKNKWFTVKYDENGVYAVSVRLGSDSREYPARFLRDTIFTINNCGQENTLSSTAFRISYDVKTDIFNIETRGSGHGVGMSQYGANVLAQSGKTYQEILQYYYKDITIDY